MARSGKVDFSDLKKFRDNLEKNLCSDEISLFIESCAKELAARLYAKVEKRTPTGNYPASTGKVGGTLKRGWTIGEIERQNGIVSIEIINPVEYASYVEYGHRTANHKGWVNGRFMLTISEQEIQSAAPGIIEKKLIKMLEEAFK